MRKLMLIIFFMPLLNIFSQQKVAVYVTGGNDSGLNKVLGDKLVEAFVKSGKYSAIERTNVFLEELSKEHDYQRTGNVKDDELSRLGKQFGVQFVCVAEVSDVFGEKYISARLINVESAEVIMTSNSGDFNIKTMTDLIQISSKLSQELSIKTGKEVYAQEEQRQIDEENSNIIANEIKKKEERKERTGQIISEIASGLANVLTGYILFDNGDKDPFYLYLNGKLIGTISGKSTLRHVVPIGNYEVKVIEKSGYIMYQQIETFNIRVESGNTVLCKWD